MNVPKAEWTIAELHESETALHFAADAAEAALRDGVRMNYPILLIVLKATAEAARAAGNLLNCVVVDLEAAMPVEASPARKTVGGAADGAHRHVFGPDGTCGKCGKVKSANGRKPAGEVAPPPDTRTLPIPGSRLVGDAAADRFTDGGQGSSGVVRR